jgi:uncharacterized protein YueI
MSEEKINFDDLNVKQAQKLLEKKEKTLENYKAFAAAIPILKKEITQIQKHIANLENENLKNEIANKWIKDGAMTPSEIRKFMEIAAQLSGKIDILDVSEVVTAVQVVYQKRQSEGKENIYDENDIKNEEIAEKPQSITQTEQKSATRGTFSYPKSGGSDLGSEENNV